MSLVELSSLFWLALTFQREFNFNGSFNITGILYVRSGILCELLCAELDAMVRKLTSLICFDIFQSKWYRNALIANTIFGTPIKAFRYHFDWKMSKLIFLISFDIFQSKWHRNGFNCKHYFWHINQSIPISLWLKNVKTDILDIFWHFSIKVTSERL